MSAEVLKYDAIVIGSGQGGNPLAQALAARGENVVLIERDHLGGTCVNNGCTPTKTMVASAQIAYYARNASRWGVHTGDVHVNLAEVMRRKDAMVHKLRSGWEHSVDQPGKPQLIQGSARFVALRRLQVNGQVFEGERVFIDTGGRPLTPKISGLESTSYLTSVSILELKELPKHLIVIGGGYIGLEYGQMFRRFGSEVTILQSGARILPNEDDDITDELKSVLEGEGIRILVNSKTSDVRQSGGEITACVTTNGAADHVTGSHLLVATGRVPNTEDLDLGKTGVGTTDKGFIQVNDRLETTAPGIWAIGDVTGGPAFTHISYNDYQIIYGNLYETANLSTKTRLVPYAVYTDPTLGRVGITERQARATGRKLKIGRARMSAVARAMERDETAGLMKLVVDAENDMVVGAAILSVEGGELIQILSTLILANKPYTLMKGAIYIHPTLAEGFFGLMEDVKQV